MRKLMPMTALAMLAFAAPAFAQDGDMPPGPDFGRLMEKANEMLQRVQELVEPLLRQIEQTMNDLLAEFEAWAEELDPGEMFGEFDAQQWMEELRRMFEGMPGFEDEEEDDEHFLLAPC